MKAVAGREIKNLQREIKLEEINVKPDNGFDFAGFDALGKPLKGRVPYETADEARYRLEMTGIKIEQLTPVSSLLNRKRDARPSLMEMAQLADQFAAQFEIGLTPDRICRILGRVHPNLAMQRALEEVANRILSGRPAHEAFEATLDKKGNPFFPTTFINAFRLGYEVGALPDPDKDESADAPVVMLRFFAQAQRRAAEIFKKIKSALIYPVSVIGAVIIAFFVEVYWIVPIFAQMFVGLLQGKDSTLPFTTQIMLDISEFFRSPLGWGVSVGFFVALGFGIYYFFFNKNGIDKRERLILRLPILKSFFVPYYGSIFCRNLSMMWASDPDVRKRFLTVAETSTNPVFRELSEHCAAQVVAGTAIGQLFNAHSHLLGLSFAPIAETIELNPGKGQQQLYTYAKYLEQEAEEKLDWAVAILGKAAFLFAAGMVVFILIASYSPLIEMVGRLSGK